MKNITKAILYLLAGIICLSFLIGLFTYLYTFLKNGVFIIIAFTFCCIFFPFLMRHGLKNLNKQLLEVQALLSRNIKINYDYEKILSAFAEILLLFWLIVPAIYLIPANILNAAVLIPVSVFIFIVEVKLSQTWEDFGFKKRYYWLINVAIYILGTILGSTINMLLY